VYGAPDLEIGIQERSNQGARAPARETGQCVFRELSD